MAQTDSFDLGNQRRESQVVNAVPGEKLDHKGIIVNPTPQEMKINWGKSLDVRNGFMLRDSKKSFGNDVDFLSLRSGRNAIRLTIDYGERIARRAGVSAISGAYLLIVDKKGVTITGYDDRGAFYGLQTLRQLLDSPAVRGGQLPYVTINDYPDLPNRGVVEGFYGEPWSHEVRMSLIDLYGKNKMNIYLYGPKDDTYHRTPGWRLPYPEEDAKKIVDLVNACNRARVDFVWAIHPGQDIKWNDEDYNNIVNKFEMMYDLGVRHFAVFFDDIDGDGTNPYKQTEWLNRLTKDFVDKKGDVSPLTLCPTDYSKLWANPSEDGALAVYGKTLNPEIKVFWTGDVVCSDLTPSTLEFVNSRIKRPAYFWWNFPVTDYARHLLMMGPSYGLDTTLTSNDVSGVLSNPMEHGEASKIALYGTADYGWNVRDFNPIDNWERALVEIVPEAPEAFRTFAIHATDTETGYRRAESWETEIFTFDNWDPTKAHALNVEFIKVQDAADRLLNAGINPLLLSEIRPWLVEFGKLGARGQRAIELGQIFSYGSSDDFFWNKYVQNVMSEEEQKSYQAHKSGTMKLQPFYDYMMADLAFLFYKKLANEIPHDYMGISSFANSGGVSSKLMLDKNDSTYYTSGVSQGPNSWIGVDLRDVRSVREVRILQGRNSVDDVDFFDYATLQYSADGKEWHTLIPELTNQYDIDWKGEEVHARYVRLLRLDSKRKNYASVRSFEINPSERGHAAMDHSLTTVFNLDGELGVDVAADTKQIVLLFGKVTTPIEVKQLSAKGEVLATDRVTSSYAQLQKVNREVTRLSINGNTEIYEIITQ